MLSWKVVYGWMDGLNYQKQREREKCSVSTHKTLVRDLHAADVRYHLDWLGVTKTQTCWSGAIVPTISSIIY